MWAGISLNGPTPIVVFEGKMDAEGYISGLEAGLKPFIEGSEDPVLIMQDTHIHTHTGYIQATRD